VRPRWSCLLSAACLLGLAEVAEAAAPPPRAAPGTISSLTWSPRSDATIVRLDLEGLPRPTVRHTRQSRPDAVFVELTGARLAAPLPRELVVDRLLVDLQVTDDRAGTVRIRLVLWRPVPYTVVETPRGVEIILGRGSVAEASSQPAVAPVSPEARPAGETPSESESGAPSTPGEGATEGAPAEGQTPAESAPEAGTAPPATEWFVENRISVVSQNIRGNRSLSFLNQGVHYIEELDAEIRHRLDDGRLFEARFSGLISDDFTLAPGQLALQGVHLKLQAPNYELEAGDTLQQLTMFTLGVPVKGVSGWYEFPLGPGLRVTAIGGVIKSRWDEFWTEPPGEQRARYVGAVRVEQRLTPDIAIGLTYLRTRDETGAPPGALPPPPPVVDPTDPRSLFDVPPPVTAQFGTPPVSNQVWSADVKARFFDGVVTFEAEAARSWVDLDVDTAGGRQSDEAYVALLGVNHAGLRATARYLQVEPNFYSGANFVIQDQQEWNIQADYDFPRWVTVGGGYIDTRDNLRHTKATTTRSRMPEARIALRELPYLPGLLIDARYRMRETDASDRSVAEIARTTGVNLQYQLGPVRFTGGYEYQIRTDSIDRDRKDRINLLSASVDGQFTVNGWIVSPGVRYEWYNDKRVREGAQDTTNRYEGLLSVDWPQVAVLTATGYYSDNSSFLPTESLVRWGGRAELRVRLFGRDDRAITVGYEYRNNDYADNTRDYVEEIAMARLVLRY
jgi:hypothetical protein